MTEALMSNAAAGTDSGVVRTYSPLDTQGYHQDSDLVQIDMDLSTVMEAQAEWERQRPGEPMPAWFLRLHSGDLSVVGGAIKPGSEWGKLNERFGREPSE